MHIGDLKIKIYKEQNNDPEDHSFYITVALEHNGLEISRDSIRIDE